MLRPRPALDAWRRRFLRRVLSTAFGLQIPLAISLVWWWHSALGVAAPFAVLLLLALANVPLVHRLLWWDDPEPLSFARVWLWEIPCVVHLCASLWSCFWGVSALLLHGVVLLLVLLGLLPWEQPWTTVPPVYWLALHAHGLLLALYAVLLRRLHVRERHIEVVLSELPSALDGYTIAHLSDLHCGPHMPRWLYRSIARRASKSGADVIVVTGDLIAQGTAYLGAVREFFSELHAPDGVFSVMGNHDYFAAGEPVAVAMKEGGARVLRNEGLLLAGDRGGFYLAGVDDTWTKRDDVDKALAGKIPGVPVIVLAHDPELFPALTQKEVALVLSGHTHAGQLALPFFVQQLNLARLRHQKTSGLFCEKNSQLFVHQGLGTSAIPARFGAAPELVLLTLRQRINE